MPRKKNDGRGRLGGRQAGTPNKDNPLKNLLHAHSVDYFASTISRNDAIAQNNDLLDVLSKYPPEYKFSKYDLDLMKMKPSDRAKAELEVLQYHTPKMQAISADMSVKDANRSMTDILLHLANGEELPPPSA